MLGQQLMRWDSIYLKPANEYAQAVFRQVEECITRTRPAVNILLNEGDTLLMDNWRVLHGRSPIENSASPRRIYRLYLSSLT